MSTITITARSLEDNGSHTLDSRSLYKDWSGIAYYEESERGLSLVWKTMAENIIDLLWEKKYYWLAEKVRLKRDRLSVTEKNYDL